MLDTHAWVWWVGQDPSLPSAARRAVVEHDSVLISAISVMEAGWLHYRNRLVLRQDFDEWLKLALDGSDVALVSVDSHVARLAGRLDWDHGDPGDRAIVATAILSNAALVTHDRVIQRSGLVDTIWK